MNLRPFLLLAFFGLAISSLAETRTWTEAATGRTLEGEFRQISGDTVEIIRPNGTLLKLPLSKLSDEDKKFVSSQGSGKAAGGGPVQRPEATHKKGEPLKEGDVIDMSFKSVQGDAIDLAAMQGKVVLLDFWATWCGPCVRELPNVKKAYDEYHDKGFEVVAISLDSDKGSLEEFMKKNDLPWPQYFDGAGWENKLGVEYGIRSIPAAYLVKDNKVIATGVRGAVLEQKLKELLAP